MITVTNSQAAIENKVTMKNKSAPIHTIMDSYMISTGAYSNAGMNENATLQTASLNMASSTMATIPDKQDIKTQLPIIPTHGQEKINGQTSVKYVDPMQNKHSDQTQSKKDSIDTLLKILKCKNGDIISSAQSSVNDAITVAQVLFTLEKFNDNEADYDMKNKSKKRREEEKA